MVSQSSEPGGLFPLTREARWSQVSLIQSCWFRKKCTHPVSLNTKRIKEEAVSLLTAPNLFQLTLYPKAVLLASLGAHYQYFCVNILCFLAKVSFHFFGLSAVFLINTQGLLYELIGKSIGLVKSEYSFHSGLPTCFLCVSMVKTGLFTIS